MITQQGTLPVGIEVGGVLHRDFELRPQKVRDSLDALEDERASSNESYLGLLMTAKQITRLGTLKPEQITVDLLLDAFDIDIQVLMEGASTLRERLKTFRAKNEELAALATGTA